MIVTTEDLHNNFSKFVIKYTQDATKAFEAGDYNEALKQLHQATELVRGVLITWQITRNA